MIFIAFFVWIGAAEEASMVQMKSALGGIPIRRAMITDFQTLSPDDSLQQALREEVEAHVNGVASEENQQRAKTVKHLKEELAEAQRQTTRDTESKPSD